MNLSTGSLSERVTIEQEARTSNGQGGYTTGWSPLATVWAEVIPLSGDEAITAQVERAVARYRVSIRRRDDVTAKHRLIWRGQTLAIKSALPHPKDLRGGLLMICESGTGS